MVKPHLGEKNISALIVVQICIGKEEISLGWAAELAKISSDYTQTKLRHTV